MKECIAYLDGEKNWHVVPQEELIRCKDCKHHGEQYGNGYCMKDGCYGWYDEDYCSRAERKPPKVNPEMVKALKDRIEKQRGEDGKTD